MLEFLILEDSCTSWGGTQLPESYNFREVSSHHPHYPSKNYFKFN